MKRTNVLLAFSGYFGTEDLPIRPFQDSVSSRDMPLASSQPMALQGLGKVQVSFECLNTILRLPFWLAAVEATNSETRSVIIFAFFARHRFIFVLLGVLVMISSLTYRLRMNTTFTPRSCTFSVKSWLDCRSTKLPHLLAPLCSRLFYPRSPASQ